MPPTATAPRTGPARGPVRRGSRRLRRRLLAGALGGAVAVGAVALAVAHQTAAHVAAAACTATSAGTTYSLSPEQMGNAAVVAAVAVRQGLPDHAVTIALATALQESKLRNLGYGDRDSLGLFQQRPSQGWGTADQISDPVYASTAFYGALTKLPRWQTDSVAVAAQAVQRSADGSAYAPWEDEARSLAVGLTGEEPAVITCSGGTLSTAKARSTETRAQVDAAVTSALGAGALTSDGPLGWAAASWLVAHSQDYGVTSVAYTGRTWTARSGVWSTGPVPPAGGVSYVLAPPAV